VAGCFDDAGGGTPKQQRGEGAGDGGVKPPDAGPDSGGIVLLDAGA
jgi:hypothetical protein